MSKAVKNIFDPPKPKAPKKALRETKKAREAADRTLEAARVRAARMLTGFGALVRDPKGFLK